MITGSRPAMHRERRRRALCPASKGLQRADRRLTLAWLYQIVIELRRRNGRSRRVLSRERREPTDATAMYLVGPAQIPEAGRRGLRRPQPGPEAASGTVGAVTIARSGGQPCLGIGA